MFYVLFVYTNGATLMVERDMMSDASIIYNHGADDPNVTFVQLGGSLFGPVFKAQEGAHLKALNSSEAVDTGRGDDTDWSKWQSPDYAYRWKLKSEKPHMWRYTVGFPDANKITEAYPGVEWEYEARLTV